MCKGILSSCKSDKICEDSICFNTSVREIEHGYFVKLDFKSKMDTILIIRSANVCNWLS